ncbi:hypothetical protein IKE99_01945 [Candidatus Saccharibacteria bacterium]|nr:hypothetical protein [Candidatus Saccharibacteria bacterium]
MKYFKEDFLKIYHNERGIIILMLFNLLLATGLFIFSITKLNPSSSVVKIGYGDIGGYRDGSWYDMLAFPLLSIIFGLFHSFLSVRIFHKRGGGMTKFFLFVTTCLILGTGLVLMRLLKEG